MVLPPSSRPDGDPVEGAERLAGATLLAGLVVAAATIGLLAWISDAVLDDETQVIDARLRLALHALASPAITEVMLVASRYGGPRYLVPLALAVALVFAVRGWPRGALLVVVTLAGAALLNALLKGAFGRVRPTPFFDYPLPDSPSYPSGHALFSICIFGGVAVLLTARLRHRWVQAVVWMLALLAIGLIGLSRVYLGVHYPSDVVAGYAVGVVWVTAVALGDRIAARWRSWSRGRERERVA